MSEPTRSLDPHGDVTGTFDSNATQTNDGRTVSVGSLTPPTEFPVIAGYEILGEIARGGMGVVYRARQLGLNREVALKMLLGADVVDTRGLVRFLAEAEAVAAVKHPHVVEVYEFGEHAGRPFLAMEYLAGGTLAGRLASGPMSPTDAAHLLERVTSAVAAAHELGIVHRDLKPANILFDEAGAPKVVDFGLAKRGGRAELTRTQAVLGTPAYMAPEQASGNTRLAGPAADVWSLGVILYECLTGRRPFVGEDSGAVLHAVRSLDATPPRKLNPTVPPDLDLLCRKCLEKEPHERYPTAAELLADLRQFGNGLPLSVRWPGVIERGAKWARRKPTLAAAYALAVVALVLTGMTVGAGWLWQRAEAAHTQAEGARASEEVARTTAEQDRANAVVARDEAARLGDQEKSARQELAVAKDVLDRLMDARTVGLAYQEYRENNPARARVLLKECRPEFRNWEWRYVHRLCNADWFTVGDGATVAAFSPDGKRLVTGHKDGTVTVWNVGSGTVVARMKGHATSRDSFSSEVRSVVFSPDGKWVATVGGDSTARVCDARSGTERHVLKGHRGVSVVAFSPKGDGLATGGYDQTARVWDLATGKQLAVLGEARVGNLGQSVEVNSVAFSPDGLLLATGHGDISVCLWDLSTGQRRYQFREGGGAISSVGFNPSGTWVMSWSWISGGNSWVTATGKQRLVPGGTSMFSSTAFSPDGTRVLIWDRGQTPEVRSMFGGRTRIYLEGPIASLSRPEFSRDASRVLGIVGDEIRVWDADTGKLQTDLKGHTGGIRSATFDPTGTRVVSVDSDGAAKVWDATHDPEREVQPVETGERVLAARGGRAVIEQKDGRSRVQDLATGKVLSVLIGATHVIDEAKLSPDGSKVFTLHRDRTARVWAADTGHIRATLPNFNARPRTTTFSPNGTRLVSMDRTVYVWDADTGRLRTTMQWPAADFPLSVGFYRDDTRIITAGRDARVRVWDADTGQRDATWEEVRGTANVQVTATADGRRVLIADRDGTARVWDVASGKVRTVLHGVSLPVRSAAFSPDGSRLVTVAGDLASQCTLWDADTGHELLTLFKGRPLSVEFSPDGTRVLAATERAFLSWDSSPRNTAFTPKELAPPPRPAQR